MRRRLTLALVGIALASVAFVGVGVLLLAQIGARGDARQEMTSQLDALADLVQNDRRDVRDLRRLRSAFEFDRLEIIAVTSEGGVRAFPNSPPLSGDIVSLRLQPEDLLTLRAGTAVFLDTDTSVVGIQPIDVGAQNPSLIPALVAETPIATIGQTARRWFLVAAVAVLAGAAVMASWLANRFTRPIAAIEAATRSIAAGDLDTRVDIAGDDELAHLGESVNAMAAELGRSRALEQQFLMSVSHDLRTPLTAIEGYAEALTDGAVDDPARTGEVISNHAQRLDRLVRDLLDLARLEARQFRMELNSIDPAITVGRTVAGLVPEAEAFGLSLTHEALAGPNVLSDPDRLAQIVANLVDNAIKYADGAISVRLAPALTPNGASVVRLSVRDDGPGIASSDLPYVFERLYVTQKRPRRAEASSGLGLAIVRELVHAMGGEVHALSTEGAGTTMVVELPAV